MKWAIEIEKRVGKWSRVWRKCLTRAEARNVRWTKYGKYNHVRIVRVS